MTEAPRNEAPVSPAAITKRGGSTSPGRRLLVRGLVGLVLLSALVTSSAWLLYATSEPGNAYAVDPDAADRRSTIAGVKTWSFETALADPVASRSGLGDLVVIDPNAIQHERRNGERKAVTALQSKPNGSRRLVLGYLSIAEAEQRRPYWQSEWLATGVAKRPAWLLEENPQRRGNWRVNIANNGWHGALYGSEDSLVDRMLAAGFDGVYLDTGGLLDVQAFKGGDRSETEWQLSELVSRIATYARLQHPRFIIMLDDADTLIDRTPVASAIDIAVKQDLLYGHVPGRANRPLDIAAAIKNLNRVTAAKRPVFIVEHLVDASLASAARARISELGYVAAITNVAKGTVNLALPADVH
jgi:cysteinyl-tRNA synthetase, unknown class